MLKTISKVIPILFFWGIFTYIVLKVPYPNTLTQANIIQLLSFFITLFLSLSSTINIFLKNIFSSSAIALGVISLLILKALDILNLITGILTAITIFLLVSYFRKIKRRSLTKLPKISKLTHMRKGDR